MCLGVPVRVAGPGDTDDLVRVVVDDGERSVNRMMIDGPLAPGDWLVLHLGFAMERIAEQDALDALELLRTLGDPDACRDEARPQPGKDTSSADG